MGNIHQHIDTAVVSRPPGIAYGHMYSMHRYWSKKSPDVVAAYIERYTEAGDIVLDPFCGSGIVACEAIRLGRRAIAIDINPMATFITRTTLKPVNLSHLQWGFRDVKAACEDILSKLFVTTCRRCGKKAVVEFVVRDDDKPIQVAYSCTCSKKRLFKDPDRRDKDLDRSSEKNRVPFWYPRDVRLPVIQKERFQYLHELFTKRNLIALSTILKAIERLEDAEIHDVMKLAFTAALDKCSRLKPLSRAKCASRPSLSEGWVAVRFYAPRMWQEVNPWHAFVRSFERIYKGKKDSNAKLKRASIGSGYEDLCKPGINVVIFTGSADVVLNEQLPKRSVDYVLTDPPFGANIQYLPLSTFWGAWLRFDFDYDKELVVDRHRGRTLEDYQRHFGQILKSIRRVARPNKYVHIFCHDIRGPYLHKMLRSMSESRISPERVLHQPPPNSFGAAVRTGKGHYGSYIIRGRAVSKDASVRYPLVEDRVRKKVAEAASVALGMRGGVVPVGTLLHSVYQKLHADEILTFARHPAEKFLEESVKEFALINGAQAQLTQQRKLTYVRDVNRQIRTALLDAESLYPNQKNQIYQSVLWRFHEEGITTDDIRVVEQSTSALEVREHRKTRLARLLCLFGTELGFRCMTHKVDSTVTWKRATGVTCLFAIRTKDILVRASQAVPKGNLVSDVGTISDQKLENALWKWCQDNPVKADELRKALNPSREFSEPPVVPKHLLLRVLRNRELCPQHFLITLRIRKGQDIEPRPGQFFHVVCDPHGKETLTDEGKERGYALTLRRPFSVHRLHYVGFDRGLLAAPSILPREIRHIVQRRVSEIDILYKVVGEGTRSLSLVRAGTLLDVLGPLGNGFDIEDTVEKGASGIIVAGGIGIAPLVALAERLRYLGVRIYMYLGAVTHIYLRPIVRDSAVERGYIDGREFCDLITRQFTEIGAEQVTVCTDDGSIGQKGLVSDILRRDVESGVLPSDKMNVFACGPWGMMEATSHLANTYKIPCQVLLEERMACGIGSCFSCTCGIRGKNGKAEKKRVCIDGPVFRSEEIVWKG